MLSLARVKNVTIFLGKLCCFSTSDCLRVRNCHYMPMLRNTFRTSSMSRLGMRVVPGFASTRMACASNFLASSPKRVGIVRIGFAIILLSVERLLLSVALFGAQR